MLEGKLALVTGSTSGIGLGIARSLAAKGARIVLNGFGDPAEIERLRSKLAADAGVDVDYEGADLSKPEEIEAMIVNIDRKSRNINLSIKAKDSAEQQEAISKMSSDSSAASGTTNLGALLKAKLDSQNQ